MIYVCCINVLMKNEKLFASKRCDKVVQQQNGGKVKRKKNLFSCCNLVSFMSSVYYNKRLVYYLSLEPNSM
jgi:hypothetical protein